MKKDEKTEGRCPNCGYCPHCGQSKRPPVIPAPYPVPVAPYHWPRPYPYSEIWSGGATSESTFRGTTTINATH